MDFALSSCISVFNYSVSYFLPLLFPRHQQEMMLMSSLSPFRYTYSMLSVIGISYAVLTWLSQTLWMPIYPLCVLAEGKQRVTLQCCLLTKQSSYNGSLNFLMIKLLFLLPLTADPVYHSWHTSLDAKKPSIKKQSWRGQQLCSVDKILGEE